MKTIENTKTKVMKKEKKTVPTQEQIDKMVLDYLTASSKHLYTSRYVWEEKFSGLYKIIPVTIQGKLHYIQIEIGDNKIKSVTIKDTSWVKTKNGLGMLKNYVFPQEKKHKSVKSLNSEEKIRLDERFKIIKKTVEANSEMSVEDLKKLIIV